MKTQLILVIYTSYVPHVVLPVTVNTTLVNTKPPLLGVCMHPPPHTHTELMWDPKSGATPPARLFFKSIFQEKRQARKCLVTCLGHSSSRGRGGIQIQSTLLAPEPRLPALPHPPSPGRFCRTETGGQSWREERKEERAEKGQSVSLSWNMFIG